MDNYELISEWGSIYRDIIDRTRTIKIYHDTPYDYVAEKVRIHSLVFKAGLPVPAVYGVKMADACMMYFYEKRFHPDTADIYLQAYCKYSNVRQEDILAWQPVIAAYQVNINTKEERDFILNIINEWYHTNY